MSGYDIDAGQMHYLHKVAVATYMETLIAQAQFTEGDVRVRPRTWEEHRRHASGSGIERRVRVDDNGTADYDR